MKNVFVFCALFFSESLFAWGAVRASLLAFLAFCLLSSAVYVLNDLVDIERDRAHPTKRFRPLAAGLVSEKVAMVFGVGLLGGALALLACLNLKFMLVALSYFALNVAYSFWLKHVVLIDIFVIAFGFVLRVVAGAVAIGVTASPWLLLCTLLLALFLGIAKRRAEVHLLEAGAGAHRKILLEYSPAMLDQLMSLVTASTVMAYSMYTFNSPQGHAMMYTIPIVLYALFRYLFLVFQRNEGGEPANILVGDRPFLIACLAWTALTFLILYLPEGTR